MAYHGEVDKDPNETAEWMESLDGLIADGGESRAEYIVDQLVEHAAKKQLSVPLSLNTPYVNTIHFPLLLLLLRHSHTQSGCLGDFFLHCYLGLALNRSSLNASSTFR